LDESLVEKALDMKNFFFYITLFLILLSYVLILTSADGDLWARLAVGKIYSQTGHVLMNDIFSYTPTKSIWIDHEWGSGVVFYQLVKNFGDKGLIFLQAMLMFAIFSIVSQIIKLNNDKKDISNLNLPFYLLLLFAFSIGNCYIVRCQMFTFFFFTVWLYTLERIRRGENRLLWIFPATSVIWANLHGGFVAGFGLLLIYALGEALNKRPFKKYLLILIPTVLVTLINPYGLKYWAYILEATTMSRLGITEWAPTDLLLFEKWKFFRIFLALITTGLLINFLRTKPKIRDLDFTKYILLSVTLFLALKHIKHQPFFVITAGSFLYNEFYLMLNSLGIWLTKLVGEKLASVYKKTIGIRDILLYSSLIVLCILELITFPMTLKISASMFPLGSIELIKMNKLKGNLATVFHWGSYAAWKLYPNIYIAEDGRYEEVYPVSTHNLVINLNYLANEKWFDLVRKHHTDILLLDKRNVSYMAMHLPASRKEWKEVFSDEISAVFLPVDKVPKNLIVPKELSYDKIVEDKYVTSIDFMK